MGTENGVIVVAYGGKAKAEAEAMIESLHQFHDWPVMAISDGAISGADMIWRFEHEGWGARWAKLNQDQLAPWDRWLYLDADTRVLGDLSAGFDVLDDGWDIAITMSQHQQSNWLWQASEEERAATWERPGIILSLQGGVFFVQRNDCTTRFFDTWRQEWQRFAHIDQAALVRSVLLCPIRLWLLGRAYNGGELVDHRFGRAVR